jgi:hypothetical protein
MNRAATPWQRARNIQPVGKILPRFVLYPHGRPATLFCKELINLISTIVEVKGRIRPQITSFESIFGPIEMLCSETIEVYTEFMRTIMCYAANPNRSRNTLNPFVFELRQKYYNVFGEAFPVSSVVTYPE